MAKSQNGWNGIASASSTLLHNWIIPTKTGDRMVPLRRGSAGFLLVHFALWWDDAISLVETGVFDDWGYNYRFIGDSGILSNHASGTALDINATQYPQGRYNLTKEERAKIQRRMTFFGGTLAHGAFYRTTVDEMHVELNAALPEVERKARQLMDSKRGKAILKANPGQAKIILS